MMKEYMEPKMITFNVFRFNQETDYLPHYKQYVVEVTQDMVMLDVLNAIKWEQDGTLSYRRSCRHGICGSCGIKVNDKPVLACKERVLDLVALFGEEMSIEPQSKSRVQKDLIIDRKDFWQKADQIKPFLIAEVDEHPAKENIVSKEDAEMIREADVCIMCGGCYYACPVIEVNPSFIGPAALAKSYRFSADVRDESKKERLKGVNELGSGIWDCVKCFACAEACPKGVNPIEKINILHTMTFTEGVAENNVATRHSVGFLDSINSHGFLDEGQLVAYSEGFGVVKHIPEAIDMFMHDKIVMPWNMPKSEKLDEVKTIIKNTKTSKF